MRHVAAQCDVGAGRRLAPPQGVGDAVRGYASVEVDQQQGEQFPPLTPAELEPRAIFDSDGQWTQDAEPRPPGPGASAEFHKIRLSAPVKERAWFGTV